jgi:hypothetical protein
VHLRGKHFVFVAGEKGRRGRGRKVRSEGGGGCMI